MLLLATVALFATSCDEILGDSDLTSSYVGDLTVSASGYTAYSNDAAEFTLEEDGDDLSILMKQIKFSEYMPVTLDITISDIPTNGSSFSISEVIPTVGGIPMEDYTITNVSGSYSATTLSMTFDCYGCNVEYSGIAE